MTHDEQLAARANERLSRKDIEWAASKSGGIYLRPRQASEGWQEWKPEPGEIEATNAVVARAIASGMTQERFAELVANGTITREVRKTMQADVR
jgi:flavorubredoxin